MDKANTLHKLEITNTEYASKHNIKFPQTMTHLTIINDSLTPLEVSLNGKDKDLELTWDDESVTLDNVAVGRLWFKTPEPTANIRVLAWTIV